MVFDAGQITFTADGFNPRIELRAGDLVVGRTLTAEDMDYLLNAFMKHGQACAAIAASMKTDDMDVPRWKRRMQDQASARQKRRKR